MGAGVKEVDVRYLVAGEGAAAEEIPEGYKRTEVGVIPEDWNVVPFGAMVTVMKGGANLAPTDFSSTGIPVLPKSGVTWGGWLKIKDDDRAYCRASLVKKFSSNVVDRGFAVIVLRDLVPSGPNIGLVVQIDDEAEYLLAQGVYGFKLKPEFDPSYLAQLSNGAEYRKLMKTILVGSTQVHIRSSTLKETGLPVPPSREEQTAIANALSDVDALINSLENLIAKKQAIKTATMQQLLTGRTRLPQFATHPDGRPKGTKQSELGEIPEDWELRSLAELAQIGSGGTPSTSVPRYWNGSVFWCTPTDITALSGKKYLAITERSITENGLKSSAAELLPVGSVVMTSRATIGECAITLVPMTTNQGLKTFRCGAQSDNEFLFYLLSSQKQRFVSLCSGSTFLEISANQVRGFRVAIPQKHEQTVIAIMLSEMDVEILSLQQRLEKTRQIKQGMMQELLTGRTRLV